MIRLIALDVDGTLLDPRGEITRETGKAIARAREKGVRVVLATGRSAQETADFARRAGCDTLAACLGGAGLTDTAAGGFLRRWDLPEKTGTQALALCLNRDIELMVFAGEQIVLDPFSKQSLVRGYPYPVFHAAAVVAEDPLSYVWEHQLPLTKVHGDWNRERYPLAKLRALPGLELTASNDHDFELVCAGVSKGRTLAMIAMMYGIPLQDCAAVGDSDNDLSMLRAVGHPVAMGNAAPEVRAAARYVTGDNGRDGVAQAIYWCLEQTQF